MNQISVSRIYPLLGLTKGSLEATLSALDGYWKAKSIVYLGELKLPTLDGVAILSWADDVREQVGKLVALRRWSSVVIRTDWREGMGPSPPLGGYLVPVHEIESEVRRFLSQGRIVILLEPRDRFRNLYGVNILYDQESPELLYLEVVGPGFDVSDINRGDVTPHERIWTDRTGIELPIVKRAVVSLSDYQRSVSNRLIKVGKLALAKRVDISTMSDPELAAAGREFLRSNRYDLLFRNSVYSAIPIPYVRKILQFVSDMPEKLVSMGQDARRFVVSSTIFEEREELVFWDIVWPHHKYSDS